jgi:hypothetical protein
MDKTGGNRAISKARSSAINVKPSVEMLDHILKTQGKSRSNQRQRRKAFRRMDKKTQKKFLRSGW